MSSRLCYEVTPPPPPGGLPLPLPRVGGLSDKQHGLGRDLDIPDPPLVSIVFNRSGGGEVSPSTEEQLKQTGRPSQLATFGKLFLHPFRLRMRATGDGVSALDRPSTQPQEMVACSISSMRGRVLLYRSQDAPPASCVGARPKRMRRTHRVCGLYVTAGVWLQYSREMTDDRIEINLHAETNVK